ncbi:hypothetical protein CBR_g21005 [Chara braunii]|uniref:F-box domain-containing protein n=1 Tax=Chara braunii TaxID=69332 RepID=A0A388L0C5_CHABU|nr:hypothetical protein CBR_g21005 [Chara braunii]|eukprot:GBG75760.1 hypothetical protein CBR_g21005 [Chara braunii]
MDLPGIGGFSWQYVASPIMRLPDEVLIQILPKLPIEDLLLSAPLVCRRWKVLARKPECFKDLDIKDWTRRQVIALSIRNPGGNKIDAWEYLFVRDGKAEVSDGSEDSEDSAGLQDPKALAGNSFPMGNKASATNMVLGMAKGSSVQAPGGSREPVAADVSLGTVNGNEGRVGSAAGCGASGAPLHTLGDGGHGASVQGSEHLNHGNCMGGLGATAGGSAKNGKQVASVQDADRSRSRAAIGMATKFADILLQRLAWAGMGHVESLKGWFLSDRGLGSLVATRPRLTHLELWGLTRNIDKSLIQLAECCPYLTHLTIHDLYHGPGCYLNECDHRENPTAITDKGLNAISQWCTELKEVHLLVPTNLRASSWEEEWVLTATAIMSLLKVSQKLQRLTLDLSGLKAKNVVDILLLLSTHASQLVYLNFSVFCLSENLGPSIPHVLRLLRKACPNLTALKLRLGNGDLSNTGVIAPHFRGMVAGRAFKELTFTKMPWFKDRHLTGLVTQLPMLERLDVSFTAVQDEGIISTMNSCPRLYRLRASKCAVTDASVEVIAEKGRRLTELRLTDTTITNKAISLLARGVCSKLQVLSLVPGHRGGHQAGLLSQSSFQAFIKKNAGLREVCLRVDSYLPPEMYKPREQKQNFDLFFASLGQVGYSLHVLVLQTEFMVGIKPDEFYQRLIDFAAVCPHLSSLGLVGFRKLTEDISGRLAAAFPLLEHVAIINSSNLSWKSVRNFATVCKRLKTVDCSGSISTLSQEKWDKLQASIPTHIELLGLNKVEWRRLRVTVPEYAEAEYRHLEPETVHAEGMLCGHFADGGLCWLDD